MAEPRAKGEPSDEAALRELDDLFDEVQRRDAVDKRWLPMSPHPAPQALGAPRRRRKLGIAVVLVALLAATFGAWQLSRDDRLTPRGSDADAPVSLAVWVHRGGEVIDLASEAPRQLMTGDRLSVRISSGLPEHTWVFVWAEDATGRRSMLVPSSIASVHQVSPDGVLTGPSTTFTVDDFGLFGDGHIAAWFVTLDASTLPIRCAIAVRFPGPR